MSHLFGKRGIDPRYLFGEFGVVVQPAFPSLVVSFLARLLAATAPAGWAFGFEGFDGLGSKVRSSVKFK